MKGVLFFIVVSVVVLCGCVSEEISYDELSEQVKQDSCYFGSAVEKQNSSICDRIYDIQIRKGCYSKVAVVSDNLSICINLWDQDSIDWCSREFAVSRSHLLLCEGIQTLYHKDSCYQGIAVAKGNISLCDKVIDQEIRGWCHIGVANVLDDVSICEDIPCSNAGRVLQNAQDVCYSYIAVSHGNILLCDKVTTQKIRDWCYQAV